MNATFDEIRKEFIHSKIGIAGVGILSTLIIMSTCTIIAIPGETFEQWNNPSKWITYPKTAMPSWINIFQIEKIPEHQIINDYSIIEQNVGVTSPQLFIKTIRHSTNFNYDQFPNDFIYNLNLNYVSNPIIEINVIRPDTKNLKLVQTSLPYVEKNVMYNERVFSTDSLIKKNLVLQSDEYKFDTSKLSSEEIIFSQSTDHEILKGNYVFLINIYSENEVTVNESQLIIGGKTFGLMGTDELRRDLAIGLLWGTPLALFIGIAVSIGSVGMGLIYGVYAGFKGKKTDEVMMRFNDVIYALPALPFLIILAVTISNSVFVMIGFLMIFGWVGVAKVSRSMALQIKTLGYVEAAKTMGQKNSTIIFKHMLPQLFPYAFASIAISVPAAITTEAGLSFLGLGDPSFPTWGQILHDASTYGAASRGLWWWIIPPGIMIAITGLAFVFIGNALDAIANPKLKKNR